MGQHVDPMQQQVNATWGAGPVNILQGEQPGTGQVFHVAGWFDWSDKRRIRYLRDLAERYGRDPKMRWYTADVLRKAGVPPREFHRQAAALLHYVQHHVYYTNEPGEQIQSPWRTLAVRTGDCDDMALLLATMLESIALPWKFALAGSTRGRPTRWLEGERFPRGFDPSHIYVYVGTPPFGATRWDAAEPTIRGLPLGHDVVLHGMPGGRGTAQDIRGGAAPYGAPIDGSTPTASVQHLSAPEPHPVTVALSVVDWRELVNAVVQGVVVSAFVGYALRGGKSA